MTNFSKKIITLFLVFTFVFSPILATKAEAQWVVVDPGNLVQAILKVVKEYGLDTLAWSLVNMIIERMAASTVEWINGGFEGKPAYVTDREAFYQDIADDEIGQFIFDNPNLKLLCGPIEAKIRLALRRSYIQDPTYQCSLTDVVGNIDGFMDDFNQGGWDGFFELTQKSQNNPIGAYLQAENELNLRISSKKGTAEKDLLEGKGFLSFKECTERGPDIVIPGVPGYPGDPTRPAIPEQRSPGLCQQEKTSTPGSVISEQLNKQLGLGSDKLAVADEFNEIISALLNQLVTKVVGGAGKGLRSLSKPDSANENQVFSGQLTDTAGEVTDYFGEGTDTSIFDNPVPDPYEDPNFIWPSSGDPDEVPFPDQTGRGQRPGTAGGGGS